MIVSNLCGVFLMQKVQGFTVSIPIKEELVSSLNAPGSTWDWSKAGGGFSMVTGSMVDLSSPGTCLPSGNDYSNIAIENGHRNRGFTHWKLWFSIAMLSYQRVHSCKPIRLFGTRAYIIFPLLPGDRLVQIGWFWVVEQLIEAGQFKFTQMAIIRSIRHFCSPGFLLATPFLVLQNTIWQRQS